MKLRDVKFNFLKVVLFVFLFFVLVSFSVGLYVVAYANGKHDSSLEEKVFSFTEKYKIVCGSGDTLTKNVNVLISNGWQTEGGVAVEFADSYCQAMVKFESMLE